MGSRQEYKKIYWAWKAIKQRCNNPKCKAYSNYGGRGIKVCDEWENFSSFLEWALANGYAAGLEIDRVDPNGNYSPNNCRWITCKENINNRRKTIFLTVNGVTRARTEWETVANISKGTVKSWVYTRGKAYAERRIEDVLRDGYKPRDYSYGHLKAVVHLESGREFPSVKETAAYFGLNKSMLSIAINHEGGKTKFGTFRFKEIN